MLKSWRVRGSPETRGVFLPYVRCWPETFGRRSRYLLVPVRATAPAFLVRLAVLMPSVAIRMAWRLAAKRLD